MSLLGSAWSQAMTFAVEPYPCENRWWGVLVLCYHQGQQEGQGSKECTMNSAQTACSYQGWCQRPQRGLEELDHSVSADSTPFQDSHAHLGPAP